MSKIILEAKGVILLEYAIALPAILLMLYALSTAFLSASKIYLNQTADEELVEEAGFLMEQVTDALKTADVANIFLKTEGNYTHLDIKRPWKTDSSERRTSYYVTDKYPVKVMKKTVSAAAPLTGDSIVGATNVTRFRLIWLDEHLLRVEIGIKSIYSKHQVSLTTVLRLPRVNDP